MTCPKVKYRARKQYAYVTKHREEGNSYSTHVLILPVRTSLLANVIYSVHTLSQCLPTLLLRAGRNLCITLAAQPSTHDACMKRTGLARVHHLHGL